MSAKCWRGRTLPHLIEWLVSPQEVAAGATVGHVDTLPPLWFEQEDRKATESIPWEVAMGSDQPQAHDSISGGLAGTHDRTFILTRCFYTTFMPAVEEQLVSDQAPSQPVLNYIIQLFLFFIFK